MLAIPNKRQPRPLVDFLTRPEFEAVLAAPNRNTWLGRRDHALLLTAVQTGLRVSEITSLRQSEVPLSSGAHVRCHGKGRKDRCTPLAKSTVNVLAAWIKEQGKDDGKILFPSVRGGSLSSDSVQHLLAKYVSAARKTCPSLSSKRVSPHVLRHTAAMELLQAGVDRSLIALWLGHESVETTQIYLDADLALKEKVLAKTTPIKLSERAIGLTINCCTFSRTSEARRTMPHGKAQTHGIGPDLRSFVTSRGLAFGIVRDSA